MINQTRYKTETHKKCKTIIPHNTFSSAARPEAFPRLSGEQALAGTGDKREAREMT